MPAWFSWLLLVLLLALPIALAFVGDEPDNSITHESGGGGEAEEDAPGALAEAA